MIVAPNKAPASSTEEGNASSITNGDSVELIVGVVGDRSEQETKAWLSFLGEGPKGAPNEEKKRFTQAESVV